MDPFQRPLPSSRLIFVLLILLGFFGIIVVRLYFLQIMQRDFFAKMAYRQYTTTLVLPTTRGTLFDRNGTPLTRNGQHLSAFIDRRTLNDKQATTAFLHDQLPLVYQEWQKHPEQSFFWIARNINDARRTALERCQDIHFMYEPARWYPYPATGLVTGFTNIDTVGMSGTERWADTQLAGTPNTVCYQKDAGDSRLFFMHNVVAAGSPGQNITISIDQHLSMLATQLLTKISQSSNASRAGALIMDPENGQILALVQSPVYNPNNPAQTTADARKNQLVGAQYEWGSLLIPFTALAALAEGITTPDELINCDGKKGHIDGYAITNDTKLGTVPFRQVVTHANSIGVTKVCKRLGHLLYDHLNRLGFTSPTGIELAPERSGFVPPPERWSNTHLLRIAHGYEVMGNAIHIGKALCVLANGGHAVCPTLQLNRRTSRNLQLYDTEPLTQVRRMLSAKADHDNITLPGYNLMTMAGSAQILKNGKYTDNELLHSYAGIIEKGDYKRVIITFLQAPKSQTKAAANLFKQLATTTTLHEQICPPPHA